MTRIYMDHNATTPVAPEVLAAILPYYSEEWGNASSVHWAGRGPKNAIDDAREAVSSLIGAPPRDVFFTSGGTESDNTALIGVAQALAGKGRHIVTSAIEHPAILDTLKSMERLQGYEITRIKVDSNGRHDLDDLRAALREDTVLVSVMLANNELGNINPIAEMSEIVHEAGALFHCDAVNALGKIPVNVAALGADLLSISAHKIYAPKGVGALYVKRKTPFEAYLRGGGQERGRRCGTYNTAGIVGFGKAAEVASPFIEADAMSSVARLRDRLEGKILAGLEGVELNGDRTDRLPNTTNLSFEGVDGEGLVLNLDLNSIAISTGSACSSGSLEPSHVLLGLDKDKRWLEAAIRFSLGRSNDEAQVDQVADTLIGEVRRLRQVVSESMG
jgi:cysteine desulfurase